MGMYVYPVLGCSLRPAFEVQAALIQRLVETGLVQPGFVVGGGSAAADFSMSVLTDDLLYRLSKKQGREIHRYYQGDSLADSLEALKAHYADPCILWGAKTFSLPAAGISPGLWMAEGDGEGADPHLYSPHFSISATPQTLEVIDWETSQDDWESDTFAMQSVGPFSAVFQFAGYHAGYNVRYGHLADSALGEVLREFWGDVEGGEDIF